MNDLSYSMTKDFEPQPTIVELIEVGLKYLVTGSLNTRGIMRWDTVVVTAVNFSGYKEIKISIAEPGVYRNDRCCKTALFEPGARQYGTASLAQNFKQA